MEPTLFKMRETCWFSLPGITAGQEVLLRSFVNHRSKRISQVSPESLRFHTCVDASAAILKQTCMESAV